MIELVTADAICTSLQLSEVLGVTPRRIDVLAEDGVLKPVRSSKFKGRRYRLADSVQRFCAYQKQYVKERCASRNGDEYDGARTRRMLAVARREELETQLRTGELLRRDSATAAIVNAMSITKAHMLSVPNRCMRQLVGLKSPAEANAIVKKHIVTALRELSEFDVNSIAGCAEASKDGEHDDSGTSTMRP